MRLTHLSPKHPLLNLLHPPSELQCTESLPRIPRGGAHLQYYHDFGVAEGVLQEVRQFRLSVGQVARSLVKGEEDLAQGAQGLVDRVRLALSRKKLQVLVVGVCMVAGGVGGEGRDARL